jgi:hypothetical protein
MSITNNRRLHKLEMSLTPKQAAILWMTEAHRFPSQYDYLVWLRDKPKSAMPLHRLYDQIEQAVIETMKGKPRDEVHRAIRHAYRDAAFLFYLHNRVNVLVYEEGQAQRFEGALLAEQLRGILHQSMASEDMMWVLYLLGVHTAYPLDSDTAAAIDAASRYAVLTWENLDESETVAEWVTDHFRRQGKTELPPDAYRSKGDGPDEETVALFEAADAYNAFVAEKDYTYGFADVHDAEYEALCDAVIQAMKALVQSGKVDRGTCVYLEDVPLLALADASLVDNAWVDHYVVELAEWGALLKAKGFVRRDVHDNHPLAWAPIDPAGIERERKQKADADQVGAIREAARTNLARYRGKTKTIDGRVHLHIDDYRRWKGRKVKSQPNVTEGMVLASWNAWVDDNGGDGITELAGVQVARLTPWFQGYDYVVYSDPARAATMQQKRREIIARLREWTVSTTDDEETPRMPLEYQTCKDKIISWSDHAWPFIAELYLNHAAIAQVSQRYFEGHPLLYADRQKGLDRLIEGMENLIDLYNRVLAPLLPRHHIDLEGIRQAVQPHVTAKETYFVHRARAETLFRFDEQDGAVAIIAPYAYGEKPGEVEVRMGSG